MRTGTAQEVRPEWLRYPDAERYSGLGHSTLWKLVKDGHIQAARVGKAVRLSRQSIDHYMGEQSVADAAD